MLILPNAINKHQPITCTGNDNVDGAYNLTQFDDSEPIHAAIKFQHKAC